MNSKLTDDNFIMFAMKVYDNPQCINIEEFYSDVKKFEWLNRFLSRYNTGNQRPERYTINMLIVLYNLFGKNTTRMLFFKIKKENWSLLITFLTFMGRMPPEIKEFNIIVKDYKINSEIMEKLREL